MIPQKMDSLQLFVGSSLDQILCENDGCTVPPALPAKLHALVRNCSENVSAYKDLRVPAAQSSDPQFLQWFGKFGLEFPFLTKANFVIPNDLPTRCLDGDPSVHSTFFHCSSGSSGSPTFWARSVSDELSVAARFEQIFNDNFNASAISTLAIVALPLGTWVGGLFTSFILRYLSLKGYRISIAAPGNQVDEILKIVQHVGQGSNFDQIVILGYPPFVKGVVDKGISVGIDWSPLNMGYVFAGEVFTEEWRQLLGTRSGLSDPLNSIISIYGTADAGVLANETKLSATIRQYLSRHPSLARELFGQDRIPSLMQYDPFSRFLELRPDDNTLSLTTMPPVFLPIEEAVKRLPLPLVRYNIGDSGGVCDFDFLINKMKENDFDPLSKVQFYRKLPFVWVFGRAFWTVSLYGANVYVENVMAGMEQLDVRDLVTGKFVLSVMEDVEGDARLGVRVELYSGVKGTAGLRTLMEDVILEQILRLNSEYSNYVPKEKQNPLVFLHEYGDSNYFPIGIKHKYT
ncbi:hypothetical protein HK096_007322 [Nowakowskiella sp. JEL0078]|nr:hypothetical protein HK096_007322 [Nowakowskiella sp. JEL0078]